MSLLDSPKDRLRSDRLLSGRIRVQYLEDALTLTPRKPVVPKLAREISQLLDEAGASRDEGLSLLRENRKKIAADRYGEEFLQSEGSE